MIERTSDYRRVNRITPWWPVISSEVLYLMETDGNRDSGVWTFHEYFDEGLLIHADMTRACRGKKAVKSMKEAFKWVFENTGTKTIYAKISKQKRPASFMAVASGMSFTHFQNNENYYQVNKNEFP